MQDEEKIFSDEPIDVDPRIAEKIGKKRPLRAFLRFAKKYKIIFIILAALSLISLGLYFFLPEISFSGTKIVNLNTEFRLEQNQTAKLKDGSVSVEIVNFINDKCPEGQTCFGSGLTQDVQYSMKIGDKKYATGSLVKAKDTEFDIETISSDYTTYATIKIIKK